MGIFKLSQFESHLTRIMGNITFDAGEAAEFINFGYSSVVGSVDFEAQKETAAIQTVTGQGDYAEPPRMLGLISLVDQTNSRLLLKKHLKYWNLLEPTAQGEPRFWARRRGTIMFWPKPNAVSTIEASYYADIAPLVLPDDVTVIATTWDWAILAKAAAYGFAEYDEDLKSELWDAKAERYIRSRMTDAEWEASAEHSQGVHVATTRGQFGQFEEE